MKTLKKIFAQVLLFIITSFAFQVKAQTIKYTWDNQSGCDWEITVYNDATPPVAYTAAGLAPATSGIGTVPSSGCLSILGTFPGKIKFVDPNCGCEITVLLPTSGTTVTSIGTICAAQGCTPCHPTNPTTQISVSPISPNLTCAEEYAIVIQ